MRLQQVPFASQNPLSQHISPSAQEPPLDRHVAQMPLSQRSPLQQSLSMPQEPPSDTHAGPHTPSTPHCSPCAQQARVVPVAQTCALGQHVLPISVVPLGHSHRQSSELIVPPSQATHWSPHANASGSSHSQNPSTQVAADGQQMALVPVPQTCALGQQASPCKQVSPV
jgi:hypothetical protein